MVIVYEYAACLLTVLTGATLLFAAGVSILLLVEGGSILARRSRELAHSATQLEGSWMAAESRDS